MTNPLQHSRLSPFTVHCLLFQRNHNPLLFIFELLLFIKILQMCKMSPELSLNMPDNSLEARGLDAFISQWAQPVLPCCSFFLCVGARAWGVGQHDAKCTMQKPAWIPGLFVDRKDWLCGKQLECTPVTFWSGVSRHHFAGLSEEWQNKDWRQGSSVLLLPCNFPPPLCLDFYKESHTFRILQPCFLNWLLLFPKCNPPFQAAWKQSV